jgi:thiol-disulfide isomerase/thioredoxin
MSRLIASLVVGLFFPLIATGLGDGPPRPPRRELSEAETELIRIIKESEAASERWFKEAEALEADQQVQFWRDKNSSNPFVAQLIAFEKQHHGSHVGLMSVRRLWRYGATNAEPAGARHDASIHVLSVLRSYGGFSELTEILRYADRCLVPHTETVLRELIEDTNATENNRTYARLTLARWILIQRAWRQGIPQWLRQADSGASPLSPETRDYWNKILVVVAADDRLPALEREATDILADLCRTAGDATEYGVDNIDADYILIVVSKQTKGVQVKDLANGHLFAEQHLRKGRPAPELMVTLLDGRQFSLTAQSNQAVIVQFCFTGCGPCEAMYPWLRDLATEYRGKVQILTIMCDDQDGGARAAVASGKLTWNVCVDGPAKAIQTQWGIRAFPTVFLFGPDGRMSIETDSQSQIRATLDELTK